MKYEDDSFGPEIDAAIARYFHEDMPGELNTYLDNAEIEHPALTVHQHIEGGIRPHFPPCTEPGFQPTQKLAHHKDGSPYIVYGCKWVGIGV